MKPVRISFVHAEKGLDADVFLIEAGFGGELRVEGRFSGSKGLDGFTM